MVRRIAEILTRGWVFQRRLPRKDGGARIVVTPEAGLRYLRLDIGKVDPTLVRLARQLVGAGDVVWDIGANVGLFSVVASTRAGSAGSILAVEADSWLVGLLRRTAALQNPANQARIEVLPCAVSDREGIVEFCIASRARSANYLAGFGTTQTGGLRSTVSVPSVSLDWLLKQRRAPAVVKIDVEGAEELVLRGGECLLQTTRPSWIVEVAGETSRSVAATFHRCGYRLFDGDDTGLSGPISECAWNTVAIPEEKLPHLRHRLDSAKEAAYAT